MTLFRCTSCPEKDAQIDRLLSMVEKLTLQVGEMADPTLQARLRSSLAPAPKAGEQKPRADRVNPYLRWRQREDRPKGGPVDERSNNEIHDSFAEKEA